MRTGRGLTSEGGRARVREDGWQIKREGLLVLGGQGVLG